MTKNKTSNPAHILSRRNFLKTSAVALTSTALTACPQPASSTLSESSTTPHPPPSTETATYYALQLTTPPIENLNVGIIGIGNRGTFHLKDYMTIEGVTVVGVCDLLEERATQVLELTKAFNHPPVKTFYGSKEAYLELLDEDIDLVIIATPWEWHVPMAVEAMRRGKHVGVEVPAATSLEECVYMIEEAEKAQKHCVMLENVNYGRLELLSLNMVQRGLLGEVVHAEGAYYHDLREDRLSADRHVPEFWRARHAIHTNANLYPTHGLGPIANCLNINRGDYFDTLVSFSSRAIAFNEYVETLPDDHSLKHEKFITGDVVSTLIRTKQGKTIFVGYNTNTPRPYSRLHVLVGSKGIIEGYPPRIYLDGDATQKHKWDDVTKYYGKGLDHPWYVEYQHYLTSSVKGKVLGHGGMDNLMNQRFVQVLQTGSTPDPGMTVYDAAVLSAITELSHVSISSGSVLNFPQFF